MEKRIQKYVEGKYPAILNFLKEITSIDRESRYVVGLTKMADCLEGVLISHGCSIERYESSEYGPTLVGRKRGTGKATILLYAHMDTVWPEGTAELRPFRMENGRAYGAGVSDCSHGIIGALYALDALCAMGYDGYGELILLFNPDEELYSPESSKYITKYAKLADVAFCMEGSDKTDEYITSRAGVMFYDLDVYGVKSHAGGMPEKGRNAIAELAYKIQLIHSLKIPDAYLHTTLIKGGINEGMVPDRAWAHVDVRVDTMEAYEKVRTEMDRIQGDTFIEGTRTVIQLRPGGCLPLSRTPDQDRFCKLIEQVGERIGHPLHEVFCGGGANAVISAMAGTPTIDGITPTSGCWHTDEEYLELSAIVPRITIMASVIYHICENSFCGNMADAILN